MYMKLRSVLITGASSGIGYALAIRLAKPGVTLHLSGRRSDALAGLAEKCCQLGANVHMKIIDVCNHQEMDKWIKSAGQLDLVLACAGISPMLRPMRMLFQNQLHSAIKSCRPI